VEFTDKNTKYLLAFSYLFVFSKENSTFASYETTTSVYMAFGVGLFDTVAGSND
jgi:hypothetical protein